MGGNGEPAARGNVEDEWAAAMAEAEEAETKVTNAKPAPLKSLTNWIKPPFRCSDLDVILDIPVTISMEVGTQIAIRNLLQLNQGQ